MSRRIHIISRLILAISVISLAAGFITPLWQIQLWAPQYPEGLNMKIWINKLSGAFDIINGLNHYIGMAMIKEEMFPELKFMSYLLGGLMAVGLWAVIRGQRKWLWVYVITLCVGGLAGMADFYRWGYEYGHNLDPHAAIQVPGMSYQPPLLGYKNLLNFTAYSGPDIGGWVLIGSGAVAGLLLGWEQFIRRAAAPIPTKTGQPSSAPVAAAILIICMLVTGCDAEPQPIRYGQDECAECRMIISDQRFGAQVVTQKGKCYKFDDVCCLAAFLERAAVPSDQVSLTLASDFKRPNQFVPVDRAAFLHNEALASPMRSDCAAFATAEEREAVVKKLGGGKSLNWSEARKLK